MTLEELTTEIYRLIDIGDETTLERFVIDHFKEFPEYMQGKILLAFLSETLEKQEGDKAIAKLQRDGMEALRKISALKAVLALPPAASA